MGALIGWSLAVVGVAVAYALYGWRGVVLAVTITVFWLLLQFSRALRALRAAGQRPVGTVANAVMLNARLQRGMPLVKILPLTGSLGEKLADQPETYRWRDEAGDAVVVELARGRTSAWRLERAP